MGIGDNFSAIPGADGLGPVGDDPRYPYVPNNNARRAPMAPISNPLDLMRVKGHHWSMRNAPSGTGGDMACGNMACGNLA